MTTQSVGVATASASERRHQQVRSALLALHRTLIEQERHDYELLYGRVGASGFLQALVNEPELAWLRPLTSALAELDQDELSDDWEALRDRVRRLLRADEPGRYGELFERSPEVAYAHSATLHALRG